MAGLENKIVRLRALEPSDVEILYNWENDTSVWQISGTLSPFSKKILA
ncbi:MAG: GNAT family N-acetyltransferase, partial [Bacteroidota bacterium]|nr:GNAT family N-acetyltransferase [Bacteroidota bacterium]